MTHQITLAYFKFFSLGLLQSVTLYKNLIFLSVQISNELSFIYIFGRNW